MLRPSRGNTVTIGAPMLTSSLDDREIQLLLVALRYWRTHRSDGVNRRTDPPLSPERVELLLAKLSSCLPPAERDPRQRTLFSGTTEPTAVPDPSAPPDTRDTPGAPRR